MSNPEGESTQSGGVGPDGQKEAMSASPGDEINLGNVADAGGIAVGRDARAAQASEVSGVVVQAQGSISGSVTTIGQRYNFAQA